MTKRIPAYPEYKDSGAAWLGKVPAHWDVKPASATFTPKSVKNSTRQPMPVVWLNDGRVMVQPSGHMPEALATYQIVDPNDIVIYLGDFQTERTSLRVGIARDRGILAPDYLCLQTVFDLLPDYGYLLLSACELQKALYGYGSGLQSTLSFADIKRLPVLVPPRNEQKLIVNTIDHFDRLIRRYTHNQQRMISLLGEQRHALINHAVTRGLNSKAALKPSGVPWLGDIPEHWEVVMNQRLFREANRKYTGEDEIQLALSLPDGWVETEKTKQQPIRPANFDNYKVCVPGDLVLDRANAQLGASAAAVLPGIVPDQYAVFSATPKLHPKYFELLFRTEPYKALYGGALRSMSSEIQNLSTQAFYNVKSIVPPLAEQAAIVRFAEHTQERVAEAMAAINQQIDAVKEYRTRLVIDVVTGKVDVRGLALPKLTDPDALLDDADQP